MTAEERLDTAILAQLDKVRALGQQYSQAFQQLLDLLEWEVHARHRGFLEVGRDLSDDSPSSSMGSRDQRFEIRAVGFPKSGDNHVGYSSNLINANSIGGVLANIPGCSTVTIIDCSTSKTVIVISGKFRMGKNTTTGK